MTEKRTAAYCVLLAIFVFAGAVFGFVGNAQARYSDMILFSTVVEAEKTDISSDVLAKENEPGVILMLGEISETAEFEFSLSASGGTNEEMLSWTVPDGLVVIRARIIQKAVSLEGEAAEETIEEIDSPAKITIGEETETKVIMEISPAANAVTTGAEKIEVTVGELSGTVIFEIPPKEEETASGGEIDTANAVLEEPVTGEDEADEGETTEGETGGTAGGENSGSTADTTESAVGKMDILSHFDPKGMLPMKADIPQGAHYVKIGLYSGEELSPLPEGTRISLNEGKDFYIIPENTVPEFSVSNITYSGGKYSVLLDFGRAEIAAGEAVTVGIEVFSESEKIAVLTGEAVPDISGAGITAIEDGTSELEIGEGEEETAPEEAEYFLLSEGEAIRISFPEEWETAAKSGYSIQLLGTAENGTVGYSNIDIISDSLWVEYAGEEGNADLIIRIGKNLPPAGKYQAIIQWNFNEICFYKKQITFFINYSTDIYSTFESQGVAGK